MTIADFHDYLDFYIDKYSGAYYSPEEKDSIIHSGSVELFADLLPLYAINQDVKDALAPFKSKYTFGTGDTASGLVTVPANNNYQKLAGLQISFTENGATRYKPVKILNDDELAKRLNSQTNPVNATNPVGEETALGVFQLYPKVAFTGEVRFLRTPVAPVFAYTAPDRVPVYNSVGSTQLEWRVTEHRRLLMKALSTLGINLADGDVVNYAELKQKQ